MMDSPIRPPRCLRALLGTTLLFALLALLTCFAPRFAAAQGRPDILWMRGGDPYPEFVSLSADGKTVVSASTNSVKFRRVSDGMVTRTISLWTGLFAKGVALSPDGKYLYVSGRGYFNDVLAEVGYLYLLSDESLVWGGPRLEGATFSPDGKYITDRAFGLVVRASDGVQTVPYLGGPGSFSADGSTFVSARTNSPEYTTFSFFDLTNNTARTFDYTLPNAAKTEGHAVAYSPDKTMIATGLWNGGTDGLYLLSAAGQARGSQPLAKLGIPNYLDSGPLFWNAAGLFVSVLEQTFGDNIYSALRFTAAPIPTQIYRLSSSKEGSQGNGFVMTPDGTRLAASGTVSKQPDGSSTSPKGRIRVYDTINNQLIYLMDKEHSGAITGVGVSTDGKTVASGSSDGTIGLWNRADGTLIRFIDANAGLGSLDFSPDGAMLVSGSSNYFSGGNGDLKMWRVSDGELLYTRPSTNGPVVSIQFSPDGTQFAATVGEYGQYGVRVYQSSDGQQLRAFNNDPYFAPYEVKFSPDGKTLAAVSGSRGYVWRLSDGELVTRFSAVGSYSTALTFSPDSGLLAYGAGNQIRLANAATGATIRVFTGHEYDITSLAFTPDGNILLSSSHDATVRFWKVVDGTLLKTYDKETNYARFANEGVLNVAFTPDGQFFTYGRSDSTIVTAKNPYWTAPRQTMLNLVSLPRPTVSRVGGNLVITVTVQNVGGDASYYTKVTSATVNGRIALSIAPSWPVTLAQGASRTVTFTFPGDAAVSGSRPFIGLSYVSQNAGSGVMSARCNTVP